MTLADLVWIDSTGYHYADFPTFLTFFTNQYKGIYGDDVVLTNDSQDGQYVTAQAQAAFDTAVQGAADYASRSPLTAQGVPLSQIVAINNIQRNIATFSSVDVDIGGTVGTTIINGVVQDTLGQLWNLPASVVIPISGTITVTATAQVKGALNAAANTVTTIYTPTAGWQTVNNASAASPGVGVQSDGSLRQQQQSSTALNSKTLLDATIGAIENLPGVLMVSDGYENDTNSTDANGIPAHSIAIVVEGGDAVAIAQAILDNKGPGCGTFGTTSETVFDERSIPSIINFYRPTTATIGVEITYTALPGFTTGYKTLIANAVAAYISALGIGAVQTDKEVILSKLYSVANLPGTPAGNTFDITLIRLKKNAGSFGTANIAILFNELPSCDPVANITFIP